MKKTYIKPENTVVMIHAESIIAYSDLTEGEGNRGDKAEAREVLISEETTIIARSAWQSW